MPISPRPKRKPQSLSTMKGNAAGSTMLPHNCRSEQRKARPTSTSFGSTDFTP